jgi:hypothetical protein
MAASAPQVKVRRTAAVAALRAVPAAFAEVLAAARAVPGALVEAVAAVAGLVALWAQLQLVTGRRALLRSDGESQGEGESAGGGDGDGRAVLAAKVEDPTGEEETFDEGEVAAVAAGDGTTRPASFTPVAADPKTPKTPKPSKSKSSDGEVRGGKALQCLFCAQPMGLCRVREEERTDRLRDNGAMRNPPQVKRVDAEVC